ncbi:MAG TPA: hypothetical protein VJK90_01085 [Acetobacteraceae bacterium]|jgi:hypothetical protein|nr:hypothetical protein [Acetobacteraceae bacterium]
MNADKLVSRVRDWLNARLSHRHISVHLREKSSSSSPPGPSQMHTEKAQALRTRAQWQNPA